MKKSRIWELDFIRGFAIIMVVIDHAMYDFAYFNSDWSHSQSSFLQSLQKLGLQYMLSDVRFLWRPSFLFLFFFVSGLCTAFSKNNLIRGIRLFVVAVLVSIVTYIAEQIVNESCFILLGVLHCIALITILYALFELLLRGGEKIFERKRHLPKKIKTVLHFSLFFLIGTAMFIINEKYNVRLSDVFGTSHLTTEYNHDWRGLFIYERSWWTADYFPLLPFLSFFFWGASVAPVLYPNKKTLFPRLDGKWHYVFSYPGRFSLLIYLLGQVVVISLCLLLSEVL